MHDGMSFNQLTAASAMPSLHTVRAYQHLIHCAISLTSVMLQGRPVSFICRKVLGKEAISRWRTLKRQPNTTAPRRSMAAVVRAATAQQAERQHSVAGLHPVAEDPSEGANGSADDEGAALGSADSRPIDIPERAVSICQQPKNVCVVKSSQEHSKICRPPALCSPRDMCDARQGSGDMLMNPLSTSAPVVEPHTPARKSRACLPACFYRLWFPAWLQRNWREFNEHLMQDQAFADAMSRRLDVAAAVFLFASYTVCAILIFSINGSLYGDNN